MVLLSQKTIEQSDSVAEAVVKAEFLQDLGVYLMKEIRFGHNSVLRQPHYIPWLDREVDLREFGSEEHLEE